MRLAPWSGCRGGTADAAERGWRLPAPEIERTIAASACTMLSDEAAIASGAVALGLAEHQLPSLFSVAANWLKHMQSEVEAASVLSALIDRVDLLESGIRVSLELPIVIAQ